MIICDATKLNEVSSNSLGACILENDIFYENLGIWDMKYYIKK